MESDNRTMVFFTIPGDPVGKGRPMHRTYSDNKGNSFVQEYTPKKTRDYEQTVGMEYMRQVKGFKFPREAALVMEIWAYKAIPKRTPKYKRQMMLDGRIRPGKKPDISNIIKSIEDGLNDVAYHDDSQIVDQHGLEFYSETPRVMVRIWAVGQKG